MSVFKDMLREVFITLHLDISQNLKYDRLTREILKKSLRPNHNCIDVGCHKGEILELMLKYSPQGQHYAFEPIPYLFKELKAKYEQQVKIFPFALSNQTGQTLFQLVKNAPAYSGLKKRKYAISNPDIEKIEVEMQTLDGIIPQEQKIHFIKIDVEGGEFGVLKGAENLLKNNKPTVLFECGKGASEYYGTSPTDLHKYMCGEIGLGIYTLDAYLKGLKPMNEAEFATCYNEQKEYYFVAAEVGLE